MNEQDAPPALLPEALAVLEAWLENREPLVSVSPAPPSVAESVRYLSGTLADETARGVERALVADAGARRLLREVRDALETLQSQSWEQVAEQAQREDLAGQTAHAWVLLASERVEVMPQASTRLSLGWEGIRRQAAEGIAEAQALLVALAAFGERLRADLRAPRLALAKGTGETKLPVEGDLPPGIEIVVRTAEVTSDDMLHVALVLQDAAGRPDIRASGKSLTLALRVYGETWPLASGHIEGAHAEFTVAAVAPAMGLAAGTSAADHLAVIVGEATVRQSGRLTLPMEVFDASGRAIPGRMGVAELIGEPQSRGGQLHITLVIPPAVRAAFADCRLLLEIAVTTHSRQYLGSWPVREWSDAPRTLTVACPGGTDFTFPFASLLYARLQAITTT